MTGELVRIKDLQHDGSQYVLRFREKNGKEREIPVRHDLEGFLLAYIGAANLKAEAPDSPLFRTVRGKTGRLTANPMLAADGARMMKRRLRAAGLPLRLSAHSCRVMGITDLLGQGVPLEEVQYLAGHSDAPTTALYDRRKKRVTRNVVERISV